MRRNFLLSLANLVVFLPFVAKAKMTEKVQEKSSEKKNLKSFDLVNIDSVSKYELPANPSLLDSIVFVKSDSLISTPTEITSSRHFIMGKKQPLLFDIPCTAEVVFHGPEKGWIINLI